MITVKLIPHDPCAVFQEKDMPLFSCVSRTTDIPSPLQPFSINQLSYEWLAANIPQDFRRERQMLYIHPVTKQFTSVNDDASFQAAVMRMRKDNHEELVFYECLQSETRFLAGDCK